MRIDTLQSIESQSRDQIAAVLPEAINKALESYHHFVATQAPYDDPKGFAAHHSAGKVAIAHIELLLKLARFVDLPTEAAKAQNLQEAMMAAVLRDADTLMASYRTARGNIEDEEAE
jgi:hypothetical protein